MLNKKLFLLITLMMVIFSASIYALSPYHSASSLMGGTITGVLNVAQESTTCNASQGIFSACNFFMSIGNTINMTKNISAPNICLNGDCRASWSGGSGSSYSGSLFHAVVNTSQAVAITNEHNCVLMDDGAVYCWGYNGHGQIAMGTDATWRGFPQKVPLPSKAKEVIQHYYTNYAIMTDGTVYSWGYNNYGQTGNGGSSNVWTPQKALYLSSITKLVVSKGTGSSSACALNSSGSVWCWGRGDMGQLGDGTWSNRQYPAIVSGLTNAIDLDMAGGEYGSACAIKSDRSVVCWGYNGYGQLGVGDSSNRNSPTAIAGGVSNVVQISSSGDSVTTRCFLTSAGTVYCAGYGGHGQIGNGGTANSPTPALVSGLTNVKSIAVGGGDYSSVHALLNDGTVKSWGYNGYGQLGDGTQTSRSTPVSTINLGTVKKMVIGGGGSYSTACYLQTDGFIKCAGNDDNGECGNGYTAGAIPTPSTVIGVTNATDLRVKGQGSNPFFCATTGPGNLKCWGYNGNGQLGFGTASPSWVSTASGVLNLNVYASDFW